MKQVEDVTLEAVLSIWLGINRQDTGEQLAPVNEFVLFRVEQRWKCFGPINSANADVCAAFLRRLAIECFICLEDELKEKWLPRDEHALAYFPK